MALQLGLVQIPCEMIEDRLGHGHLLFYALVGVDPRVSYEAAAEKLELTPKRIQRIENDLIERGYLEVARIRGSAGEKLHRTVFKGGERRESLDRAS